jgi:hypothetical protein
VDPELAFHSNTDPDSVSKNTADLCGSGSKTLALKRDKMAESGHERNVPYSKLKKNRRKREKPCA